MSVDTNIIERVPEILKRKDILQKYLDAHDEEFATLEQDRQNVIEAHQVDVATGDDLDRIGAIFGELGRRRGRSDSNYSSYLQSVVKSFNGRGTRDGLKFAVSASVNASPSDVEILEDFDKLEYSLRLNNWNPHAGTLIEDISDLADPSVVQLDKVRYAVPDKTDVSDPVSVTQGNSFTDNMLSDDSISTDVSPAVSGTWGSDNWDFAEWQ